MSPQDISPLIGFSCTVSVGQQFTFIAAYVTRTLLP